MSEKSEASVPSFDSRQARARLGNRVNVLASTMAQGRSFAVMVLTYARALEQGESPPIPANLLYCAAASMVSQIEADIAINGSAAALKDWDENFETWLNATME